MPEIVRRERRWVGRRNKWVSFPYTIRKIGRWWRVSVQLESGNFVRLDGRFGPLQDAMDAAAEHQERCKKDEPELEEPSADAAVQEHVQEDTSPIEVTATDFDDQVEEEPEDDEDDECAELEAEPVEALED